MIGKALALLFLAAGARPLEAADRLGAACGEEASIEQILGTKELISTPNEMSYQALNYYLCLSVAKHDEAACGALDAIARTSPPEFGCPDAPFHSSTEICRSNFGRVALSKALITRDPAARSLCLKRGINGGERPMSARANEDQCGFLLSSGDDVPGACARRLKREWESDSDTKDCEKGVRDYWGLSEPCDARLIQQSISKSADSRTVPLVGGAHAAQACVVSNAAALFRKARAAGGPEPCGKDGLCLAMMGGGPESCQGYADAVQSAKKAYCAEAANRPPSARNPGQGALPAARRPAAPEIGIEWVEIPSGIFSMGAGRQAHRVAVKSFQLAKTLVTQKQYKACVAVGACRPARDYGSRQDGDDQPVLGVDWPDADAFSKWVGGRLPSEAEWEYAARSGGRDQAYPWGNAPATCETAVIAAGGLPGCGRDSSWPVCSKPAGNTAQGLCDMAGELWEWVQDWYHASYEGAPSDGSAWEEPPGLYHVLRGGSWNSGADRARASYRAYGHGGRYDGRGFRPARSI